MKRTTREELFRMYPDELAGEVDEQVIDFLLIYQDIKKASYLEGYRDGMKAASKELPLQGEKI